MKIVLDTNVLMSGLFWSGVPAKILDSWQQGKIKLCLTPDILEEYLRVANELSKKYPGIDDSAFLDLLTVYAEIYPNTYLPNTVSRDGDDDKFIACALEANAKVIVSGDKDLSDLKAYKDIEILTPKQFIEKYKL